MKCVRPTGCLDPSRLIYIEEIESGDIEVVKVECNNKQCEEGEYMHAECFLEWEEMVLNFLSSTGRARSWSLRQRYQNLWTKKGYDLAFKVLAASIFLLYFHISYVTPSHRIYHRHLWI